MFNSISITFKVFVCVSVISGRMLIIAWMSLKVDELESDGFVFELLQDVNVFVLCHFQYKSTTFN